MQTLAIISRKGGTGKSTLAIHLAVEAEKHGHTTAIIDLDPQGSVIKWSDTRENESPVVISAHAIRLPQILHKAEQSGVTLAILDTSPRTEDTALDAARAADLVVIPCRPARFDLQAIGATVDIANIAKVESRIIFNAVPARSSMIDPAKRAVEVYKGSPCAPTMIGHRVAFSHATVDGQTAQEFDPKSKASLEIAALYRYLSKELEGK